MTVTLQQLLDAGLPALTCDGQDATWSRGLTTQEWATVFDIFHPEISRPKNARLAAKNIPNWATWTEAQAQTWGMANIGQPLIDGRANLPGSLTLASTRVVILSIITILDAMWAMMWALARMVIALRNDRWDLSE